MIFWVIILGGLLIVPVSFLLAPKIGDIIRKWQSKGSSNGY